MDLMDSWVSHLLSGLGGTAVAGHDAEQVETMIPVKDSVIKITYNSDTHTSMQWNCPQQSRDIQWFHETALAFYRAKNPTNKPVIWISTNNAVPFEAGQYFNKIQPIGFPVINLLPDLLDYITSLFPACTVAFLDPQCMTFRLPLDPATCLPLWSFAINTCCALRLKPALCLPSCSLHCDTKWKKWKR